MSESNEPEHWDKPSGPEPPHECRIRFGKPPSSTLPAAWAEMMLTELAAKNPKTFGRLLVNAATGSGGPDGNA